MESNCPDCAELGRQLRLVQSHCKTQWSRGHLLGLSTKEVEVKQLYREVQYWKDLYYTQNAEFTEEIMKLEEQLNHKREVYGI